jgi:hypothetical protein
MSPQEIKLTVKVGTILAITSIIFSGGVAWATASSRACETERRIEQVESQQIILNERVSTVQLEVARALGKIETDVAWMVTTMDRMQRAIERMAEQ